METKLSQKIKQIINPQNKDSFQLNFQNSQIIIKNLAEQVKAIIKEEQSSISKDLAKKTKQLFVLSSDNESLKEKVQDLQNKIKRSNDKVSQKDKQIVKLMNDKQKQKRQLQQQFYEKVSELRKQISNLELKMFESETKYKGEISDLRKAHKQQISKAIIHEQEVAQSNLQRVSKEFSNEKKNLIQELRDKNEKEVFQLTKNHNQIKDKDSKIKSDLNNKLFTFQNTIKRLEGELSKETLAHQKLKGFSSSLSSQLEQLQIDYTKEVQELNDKLLKTRDQQSKNEKQMRDQINKLKQTLRTTIIQKDLLYEQTVNTMNNEHRDELQSLKVSMMQQKEIEITENQMKHYVEIQKMNNTFYQLEKQFNDVNSAYKTVKIQYETKINNIIQENQIQLNTIEKRNHYQITLEEQSAKKYQSALERKYKLEIKSLNKLLEEAKQQLTKKINDQRLSVTNKLTTQYQTIINDIKINNQVNVKQKLIEFDRKSKAYEKKLAEAEKRRVDLKIQMDRQKLELQMKIDSLSDLTQKLESEIQELHQHIIKLEKQKTIITNEFQFKLIMKKNEFQQLKDQFQVKEHELRTIFNEQIRIKNSEIQRFSEKIAIQVQNMISKQNKRVELVEKQYKEFKKIMNERTSLPQDIQALRIFHQGYIKLEQQLERQRQMKKSVQRQLHSKCAIQKVFTSKAFIPRTEDPNPIKIVTMREFYKPIQKSINLRVKNNL